MSKEDELALLKFHLGITPKTANLLHSSGYTTPKSLANSTPNEVVSKFAALPGMDMKKAKDYARPARRMVMLGAIEDGKEAATVVKTFKVWSNKHLVRIGVWEDGFNDLNGVAILMKMQSVPWPQRP